MKNLFLILLLALLGMTQAVAQEYEYVPFVREGVKWVYANKTIFHDGGPYDKPDNGLGVVYHTLELKGDTVINGKAYKAMHMYSGEAIDMEHDTIPVYLREEDKVVYGIVPEGTKSYSECPVGNLYMFFYVINDIDECYHGEEFVLYDFKDFEGYISNISHEHMYPISMITDTVVVGNHKAKRHNIYNSHVQFIEGVGAVNDGSGYTIYPMVPQILDITSYDIYYLSHVVEDGEIIYKTKFYTDDRCYLPLLREGVKWVNERVIVNHGETTCQYYIYELNGDTFERYNRVCKSINYSQGTESDSIIAGLREVNGWIYSLNNYALDRTIAQDRNLIDYSNPPYLYGSNTLYNLDLSKEEMYLKYVMREPLLTDDNFVKVDPVEIEGVTCSRYAYLGEDGEPLAYVVEGIGFDSYDMGDLLTPFTRKPDPNADYQEWCGLCHVVKDGRVIYKGMRYTPDNMTGIDEVVADQRPRHYDGNYYDLTGRCMGTEVPTTPGIYIHNGNKICVSRMQ